MASLSLAELLIGSDFHQVYVLAWDGYLLEQSSVFNTVFVQFIKSSNLCGLLVAWKCNGGMVGCLLIRAKLFWISHLGIRHD
jgi:hypothetical protein